MASAKLRVAASKNTVAKDKKGVAARIGVIEEALRGRTNLSRRSRSKVYTDLPRSLVRGAAGGAPDALRALDAADDGPAAAAPTKQREA